MDVIVDGKGKPLPKPARDSVSPDGKRTAFIKDANVYLKGMASALTQDGEAESAYRGIHWSPDSQAFVSLRVRQGQEHKVTIVESSPSDQGQPKLMVRDYLKAGDRLPEPRPVLFDAATGKATVIDNALFPTFFAPSGDIGIRWSTEGDEFFFDYNQRGHQLYRIIAVNARTGAARVVVEETSKTFIDYTHKTWRQWLDKTGELLWMSERDGWCHLWLYDVKSGKARKRVTQGNWVVRQVEWVDEDRRQVWFMASGLRAGEDPYHEHLCRVDFDGSGFVRFTEGDGSHKTSFSPDHRFSIDTWSRADKPPVTELRHGNSGRLVTELEHADAGALMAAGWSLPERFVAKGRDGKTDIHGIIIKPSNYDPTKKYPVVEKVYAGPHGAFAPKTFGLLIKEHELAELGFIIVQSDGMGTNHRGKVFHDVCWKNLKDAGFPDRIEWIKSAATTRPWMDLKRVGIYGGSAGGQSAMRALLDHHDFYSVAVADCGCHDNRMDKVWWNEQWLGWPVDESYARNSNVVDAAKLEGHLMLAMGELDTNVDPATTMQVANALEKADKDFDLVVMTNTGHGSLETPYGSRRRMDFLVRHLLNVEPRWQK
ncbi:MAG: ptpA 2 [Verrucomicrobiaceae bacterium]|nr:ptpA 2 [Verrucomicrobiaceae bacterium]